MNRIQKANGEEAKSGVKSAQNKQVTKSVPKKKIYRKRFV